MGKKNHEQPASSEEKKVTPPPAAGTFTLSQVPVVGEEPVVAKYEVAPEPIAPPAVSPPAYEDLGELPASYHEETLFLTARDPRWLFAYWDFDWTKVPAQGFRYGAPIFYLRIAQATGAVETTVEVQPQARNWYVPVSAPGAAYFAELGYYNNDGTFVTCLRSGITTTPPESLAEDHAPAQFATVPATLSFESLLELVKTQIQDGESLLGAVARLTGTEAITFRGGQAPTWTDEQRALLAALLGGALIDRMGLGSAELDELLRKTLHERLHSESASGFGAVWQRALGLGGESSLFSGFGFGASWSAQPFSLKVERGFFMHVNAEVIFYGGTHPDASVTIDGKAITLNPDGTFRYHFRLPDGDWRIPIVARSPDKAETRSATLTFQRTTTKAGEVTDTPQPTELPPEPMGRV
jgi:hypothetical protein